MSPKVGTLERRSPLPPGTYWVDVFGLNIPKADVWFKGFGPSGVHVDATQHFESPEVSSVRNWYKFTYNPVAPGVVVVWDTSLGFPTVADASIQSSEDTVQRPPLPLDPLEEMSNWLNALEAKLGGSLGFAASIIPYAVVGGAAYLGYLALKETVLAKQAYRKVKSSVKRIR